MFLACPSNTTRTKFAYITYIGLLIPMVTITVKIYKTSGKYVEPPKLY